MEKLPDHGLGRWTQIVKLPKAFYTDLMQSLVGFSIKCFKYSWDYYGTRLFFTTNSSNNAQGKKKAREVTFPNCTTKQYILKQYSTAINTDPQINETEQ